MVVKVTKIEQKMRNKKLVEHIKIYYKMKKKNLITTRNLFLKVMV